MVFLYSHQRPWGSERLGGRYTPVERLRRRLRDCLQEARLLGDDARWGRLVSPISTTVGSWARRSKAAASGRAASITTRVSGRWARGSSRYTTPGLSLIASPASRVGQVIWGLAGRPEKGLVQGCSREGEERPDPELFTLEGFWQSNPAWGLEEPAFKALEIYSGPGQTGTLYFYWSLEREAVSDERSGCFGLCTLGYSSSGWGH